MNIATRTLGALSFALCLATATFADPPAPTVALSGAVTTPSTLSLADLKAMPAIDVTISFVTGHGSESGTYRGALLWTVLDKSGLADGPAKGARLRHTILVSGNDGYQVALSEGELDPNFEGKQVILAYAENGKDLDPADGIRLIVPGDHHGGRAVKGVVRIEMN
jgi:DMSO/TMAO reductase YedYZ molybdopterin-dependent catalytic subunit